MKKIEKLGTTRGNYPSFDDITNKINEIIDVLNGPPNTKSAYDLNNGYVRKKK